MFLQSCHVVVDFDKFQTKSVQSYNKAATKRCAVTHFNKEWRLSESFFNKELGVPEEITNLSKLLVNLDN